MTTTAEPTTDARGTGGYVVQLMRESAGLTQQQLADLAGVSRGQLGRIERGEAETFADGRPCRFCGSVGNGPTDTLGRVTDALAIYAAGRP
jgi:hypothetical protein